MKIQFVNQGWHFGWGKWPEAHPVQFFSWIWIGPLQIRFLYSVAEVEKQRKAFQRREVKSNG